MGWEHDRYEAICEACGRTGKCIVSSDDWGRWATEWIGFEEQNPSSTAVARLRVGSRDMSPKCACGSINVRRGGRIAEE